MTRSAPDSAPRPARLRGRPARPVVALAVGLLWGGGAAAAAPPQPDAAALLRAVERLGVVGNVLYVAAHPDDENTRLLAYLVGARGLRTAYLSLTRGDGGQNLLGPEQGEALGLIRTEELLAARRVDGAEQLFTRVRDFGYSKSAAETLRVWGHDEALADVVLALRRFRPDVVISRFPPDGLVTHGQHTASAQLVVEAFRAAADPRRFPEQLPFAGPWQARRLLLNVPRWGRPPWGRPAGRGPADAVELDVGGYDPVRGESFGEIAARARSMHRSQGFGSAAHRGPALELFTPLAGEPPPKGGGIFGGLDLTWRRVPGGARLATVLQEAAARFEPRRPEASLPLLLEARRELVRLPPSPWREPKLRDLDAVIVACAGLFLDATTAAAQVTPGGRLPVALVALNRTAVAVRLEEVRLPGTTVAVGRALPRHAPIELRRTVTVPAATPISQPYWLESPGTPGRYTVADPRLVGLPARPPALVADFVVRVGGTRLVVTRAIAHAWVDPAAGERRRALTVAPAVTVTPAAPLAVFPGPGPRTITVRLRAEGDAVAGRLRAVVPAGFGVTPAAVPFRLARRGDEVEVRLTVRPPAAAAAGTLRLEAEVGRARYGRGRAVIDYPHLARIQWFPAAEVALRRFDLVRGRGRIAYLPGAGDEVPAALRRVGYDVTVLDPAALDGVPLGGFAAVVLGVRAFNTDPGLARRLPRLLEYVAAGGTLVVQYNTNNRLAPLTAAIGPYPLTISQQRVTDETAPVVFSLPRHPLLRRPNRITAADFDGWVQERGLYFAGSWSDRYQAPLALHDPGEPPRRGGLLHARYGRGVFVYTGLAFFRQLPAGVPGAYRLFANLLAHGR